MKNILATITVSLAGLFLATFAQAQGSLEGAWQAQEIMISGGNNAGTYDTLGLIVFSEGHYSAFSNIGDRPDIPDGPGPLENDEQRVASFLAFRANAGTYEISGSTLMLHFMLARNPRVVGNNTESEYSIDGDTLTITATNAQDVVTRTTYARVD